MSASAQLIGTRLGAYEIQGLLGSGGMATVYRGFDTNLRRAVAIKVLSPFVAAEPGFVERFEQEARLIANLRHPNIVQVYDLGEHDSLIYMIQELLPGPTLEAWMRDRAAQGVRLSPAEITQIITQLGGALDAAHAAGIVHRDVKPANALWNDQGMLVLTDFGIAKQLVGGTNQTQFGIVFGTPSYLSPEQAQSLPPTPASDIYSLGVMLYELIAGQVPFPGNTPMRVAIEHIQTPPPPLPARPDLPSEVEVVVQRALAKDPAARFRSAGKLADALARAWQVMQIQPRPPVNADIHNQPTRVWQPPARAASQASISTPPASAIASSLAPQTTAKSPSPGSPSRLVVLGTILALLLLSGVVLAARGSGRSADTPGRGGTAAPLAAAAPTAAAPAQPSPPSHSTPSQSSDGFASLRALIDAGGASGKAGTHRDELLVAVAAIFGVERNGARLWLNLGAFQFQPVELLKILLVVYLATYLDERRHLIGASYYLKGVRLPPLPYLVPIVLMWGLTIGLIIIQKDLGAALLFFTIFLAMLYALTGRASYVVAGLLAFAAGAAALYPVFGHVRVRVDAWRDPWADPLGRGYQMVQAVYALASGGVAGAGLGRGDPTMVPESHTDFMFTSIGEELGFVGALALLLCYVLFALRGYQIAQHARDGFQQLLAVGLTTAIVAQALIITAGTTNLIPLTGITLPFVSYGGSSTLINFAMVGMLLRISATQKRPRVL